MTMNDVLNLALSVFPDATVELDNDRQVVIYTGLECRDESTVVPFEEE